jgi:hypothetical protein
MKRLQRSEIRIGLSLREVEHLIDALEEWNDTVGPKELEEGEVGLNRERYIDVMLKLKTYLRRINLEFNEKTS